MLIPPDFYVEGTGSMVMAVRAQGQIPPSAGLVSGVTRRDPAHVEVAGRVTLIKIGITEGMLPGVGIDVAEMALGRADMTGEADAT